MSDQFKFLQVSKFGESKSEIGIQDSGDGDYFSMHLSQPLSPLPTDCIDQMYKEGGIAEGSTDHMLLEKSKGFSYQTLLGERMYSYIAC